MGSLELRQLSTRAFARVLALFLVFVPFFVSIAATMVDRASDMRTLLSDFDANGEWPWVTGAFLFLAFSAASAGKSWGNAQAGATRQQLVGAWTGGGF